MNGSAQNHWPPVMWALSHLKNDTRAQTLAWQVTAFPQVGFLMCKVGTARAPTSSRRRP